VIGIGGSTTGWTPIVVLFVALAALLALAVGPASADPGIRDKQAQAQAILVELDSLDQSLAVAIEAYNYANVELDRIDVDLDKNARHLVAARKSLKVSQKRIAKRLRDLYVKGDGDSTLEVLLGSRSLDDVIARVEAIQRVSSQDARILNEVKRYKAEVEAHRKSLRESRADQVRIVDERASQRASIEGQLAERQALYASVKDEIVRLQEAEQRRQAALAAQARARAQAAELAAQAAASAPQTSVATTTYDPGIVPVAPPPDGTRASQVVSIALQYLGVPYVWGGMSPSGFDCSGLTSYVYAQIGISLPHHAASQFNYGVPVGYDDLQPADLVFFSGLGHMGMYIGGGQFIHAPHTGDVVRIAYMSERAGDFVGARRVL
jgi:peptidoglycan DL-endopeptidase CwlO